MTTSNKRFARVIVVNQDGKVLAICHAGKPGFHYCFPGGKVEKKEEPRKAASRELYEELGLRVSARKLRHCFSSQFDFNGEVWKGYFYICSYPGQWPTVMEYPKILSAEFFSLSDLSVLPADRKSFADVAHHSEHKILSTLAKIVDARPLG